jgi:hypothetical protein
MAVSITAPTRTFILTVPLEAAEPMGESPGLVAKVTPVAQAELLGARGRWLARRVRLTEGAWMVMPLKTEVAPMHLLTARLPWRRQV